MARCLQLAVLGLGRVAPNPMVGAVLVHMERVIGEGYHEIYGESHAEVNCINNVSKEDRHLISESVLYVSLEPCAHFGKTPPCADFITQHKIPKVVIGCRDIFSAVNGQGIEKLRAAGITVVEGVLERHATALNKRFFCFHKKQRPYIFLKWAQTADGFIAKPGYESIRISNELSNRWVHRLRSSEAAIMVGTNTALHDNPSLTTRLWTGKNPARIVIDKNLSLPRTAAIFSPEAQVYILNILNDADEGHIHPRKITPGLPLLPQLIALLCQQQLQSLIVEGGAVLLKSFIDADLWDEAVIITNQAMVTEKGIAAPTGTNGSLTDCFHFQHDKIEVYKNWFP